MADVRLTRRYRFSASHRLHSEQLSEERNREVYGKCNNPYGHGHDYVLEVTVRGEVDEGRGRLIGIEALDGLVERVVLRKFDRRNLNVEVGEFAALVPTTEVLAGVIERRLREGWAEEFGSAGARFEKLRIEETRKNIFEVYAAGAA